jgi:hypothetical protein
VARPETIAGLAFAIQDRRLAMGKPDVDRRTFLRIGSIAGGGLLVPVGAVAEERGRGRGAEHEEEDVAPPEDLMREHGVLKRVLLVYEEAIRRIDAKQELSPDAVRNGAGIIRTFIEDYHGSSRRITSFHGSTRLVG